MIEDSKETTRQIVDSAYRIHVGLGPGLLESVYETVLARDLVRRGLRIERQKVLSFEFDGLRFDDNLRIDLLVESNVIVEVKSVERVLPVHGKQLLTYLRLARLRVGLLLNFGAGLMKDGIQRIVN